MTLHNDPRPILLGLLENLIGKLAWAILCGPSTGSALSMEFGDLRPRSIPLTNSRLSAVEQRNEGELGLYVQSAWRLDADGKVVCGSESVSEEMMTGVGLLEGRRVERASADPQTLDLTLRFSGDARLMVFCDEVDPEEGRDNYSLNTEELIYIVAPRSAVRVERRSGPLRPALRLV